jgi:hypothetical protein
VPLPLVTVVVVTWQQRELVLDCLESVAAQTVPCRVLVVDNASTDGTADAVRARVPEVELVLLPENRGFAGAGLDAERVTPTDSSAFVRPAPRPAYSVLGHDAWANTGLSPMRDWREALDEAFETGALTAP